MHDGEPILLGFSGGIDSCAAASTLKADGWSVTALTLDMTGNEHLTDEARRLLQQARDAGITNAQKNLDILDL